MAILTLPQFTDYLRNEIGAGDSPHAQTALAAAEGALSSVCQRQWVVAGASSARLYVPDGSGVLRIHDATAVSLVVLDGATVTSTLYQLEPLNNVAWDGTVWPYERIYRLGGTWTASTPGKATVSVTATWGWASIPAAIVEACKILGKGIVEMRNSRGGVIASDAFGPVRVSRDIAAQVRSLVDPFMRVEAFGIA